jgi:flagellar hook-basal body protein
MDLYTAAMGMISNMTKMDVTSNNIANVDTNGYKYDQTSIKVFDEAYRNIQKNDDNRRIGGYKDENYVDNISTNFDPGAFKQTYRALDFALHDNEQTGDVSFFTVKKGDAEYLTRNGQFTLDADRRLSTQNGALVLDKNNNPIVIPQGVDFYTTSTGDIVESNTKKQIAQLKLQSVGSNDLGYLEKKYGGFFQVTPISEITKNFGSVQNILNNFDTNSTLQAKFKDKATLQNALTSGQIRVLKPFSGEMKDGMVEGSNVDYTKELVGLMNTERDVHSNQKAFTIQDSILQKAANDIAK